VFGKAAAMTAKNKSGAEERGNCVGGEKWKRVATTGQP